MIQHITMRPAVEMLIDQLSTAGAKLVKKYFVEMVFSRKLVANCIVNYNGARVIINVQEPLHSANSVIDEITINTDRLVVVVHPLEFSTKNVSVGYIDETLLDDHRTHVAVELRMLATSAMGL